MAAPSPLAVERLPSTACGIPVALLASHQRTLRLTQAFHKRGTKQHPQCNGHYIVLHVAIQLENAGMCRIDVWLWEMGLAYKPSLLYSSHGPMATLGLSFPIFKSRGDTYIPGLLDRNWVKISSKCQLLNFLVLLQLLCLFFFFQPNSIHCFCTTPSALCNLYIKQNKFFKKKANIFRLD